MLYLFNSGFSLLYLNNVLNTLYYPSNYINRYRYRYKDDQNINSLDLDEYFKLKKEPTIIIFIDRYSKTGEYRYIPLRAGNFIKASKDGSEIYFDIELKQFVASKDVDKFTELLIKKLEGKNFPKFTNNQDNIRDGYYAIIDDDLNIESEDYLIGEDAWEMIIGQLQKLKIFKEVEGKILHTIFARIQLREKDKDVKISSGKGTSLYRLYENKIYHLNLIYKIPTFDNRIKLQFKINADESIKLLSSNTYRLENKSDMIDIYLKSQRSNEVSYNKIETVFEAEEKSDFKAPKISITTKISRRFMVWVTLLVLLVIYSLADIYTLYLNSEEDIEPKFEEFIQFIFTIEGIFVFVKIIILFIAFKILGNIFFK